MHFYSGISEISLNTRNNTSYIYKLKNKMLVTPWILQTPMFTSWYIKQFITTRARVAQWVSLSPIWRGFAPSLVNYKKTQLTAASDKVYQLLAHGRWFSPGTAASSTTKTGRHDIAEILLKVVSNTKNQIKSNHIMIYQAIHNYKLIFIVCLYCIMSPSTSFKVKLC